MIKPFIEEIDKKILPADLFNIVQSRPYNFFLDSSSDDRKLGRYSFLGCDPFLVFKSKGNDISLEWADGVREDIKADPFRTLKGLLNRFRCEGLEPGLPFTSGAVGYFSYDMKDLIERLPDRSLDDLGLPDCILGFYDCVFICDNLEKKVFLASSGMPETDNQANLKRREERAARFKDMLLDLQSSAPDAALFSTDASRLESNFSFEEYRDAVRKAKDHIRKGDIYQVNLSQRFKVPFRAGSAPRLYSALREVSPAPFSSYLGFGDVRILSSSPERFILKKGRYIETRPIKGTRPRGKDDISDRLLESELSNSAKDRAEHIMIVDLERNDLGKICEYGSVKVCEPFIMEKYANVFHLVSTVAGKLKENADPIDCILALFPGGSITGAPKIRSMQIIESLEPVKRSVYTGAIGYISFDGNMDTSIAIRTFINKGSDLYFQVGGGIVADSVPEQEYEETVHKAAGLLAALGITDTDTLLNGFKLENEVIA